MPTGTLLLFLCHFRFVSFLALSLSLSLSLSFLAWCSSFLRIADECDRAAGAVWMPLCEEHGEEGLVNVSNGLKCKSVALFF